MIKKTLGGDRLGSGNRMKQQMHDFYRSNKNLSTSFASTMAPGVLYPCYTNIALKGDTFDIDLNAFVRTVPTISPLYGSFKLQIDFFQVPFRLYQAILHNNTTDIARKMNQVYLPKVLLPAYVTQEEHENGFQTQINESALMRYLNISGVGTPFSSVPNAGVKRKFNAIPMLAYYDIFKNYYANKQEENAYVITPNFDEAPQIISQLDFQYKTGFGVQFQDVVAFGESNDITVDLPANINVFNIRGINLNTRNITLRVERNGVGVTLEDTIYNLAKDLKIRYFGEPTPTFISISKGFYAGDKVTVIADQTATQESTIKLQTFPLSNIDDMRKYLLTQWELGQEVVISNNNQSYLPYSSITGSYGTQAYNKYALNGLVVKTYQSDMFNNWLDTEWVNEITYNSRIDTSNGSFTLDMLNFKKKLYDHLNRLAISGGTYDDWQEATYGDRVWGKSEKPIYCGGMSSEVIFDEVVSTAASGEEPLGEIAGRGTLNGRKGGHITIKVGEASVIMGIVSLTPRISYTQGNAWYNTELDTMDDLHKPIFDRIGFQDLMIEQMAWWDAKLELDVDDGWVVRSRTSAGKQPAWLQYATDIDRAYGDFAKPNGLNTMILSRNYEQSEEGLVQDVTTYIDPEKFNYAFAYKHLSAQNFWTFINMKIHARRKMSNTQIPNV